VDHPVACDADDDGGEAFEDLRGVLADVTANVGGDWWVSYEYPCPSRLAGHAAHLSDSGCEQAAEGAGECGGGEEYRGADAEFRALVPA
jgi:hypothetical protein